jgi:hypothetical protein
VPSSYSLISVVVVAVPFLPPFIYIGYSFKFLVDQVLI